MKSKIRKIKVNLEVLDLDALLERAWVCDRDNCESGLTGTIPFLFNHEIATYYKYECTDCWDKSHKPVNPIQMNVQDCKNIATDWLPVVQRNLGQATFQLGTNYCRNDIRRFLDAGQRKELSQMLKPFIGRKLIKSTSYRHICRAIGSQIINQKVA